MASHFRTWMAGTAVAIGLAGGPAGAQAEAQLRLLVRITDRIGVPGSVLAATRHQVERIYSSTGVDIVWIDPADDPAGAPVTVAIVEDAMARRLKVRASSALGVTPRSKERAGRLAYVFYGRVQRAAAGHRIETAPILSAAIAHEIGHMLLPRGSHGPAGLMRAAWDEQDFRLAASGLLQFTRAEAALIQTRLQ